jgi:phosphoribosylformimino-5-aminoimidazole carboxamide ribotide isomerase
MIIFPAIDLRGGRCVRLVQGEPDDETVYAEDPVAVARRWVGAGARWLHVVNLDGAFAGGLGGEPAECGLPINLCRLRDIASETRVPIQFGGGLRTFEDIELVLSLGASRVILGTLAVRQPEWVSQAVERFGPDRVVVGIDARNGVVATQGWQEISHLDAVELGRQMAQRGVRWVVYTDIQRDGMLSGVNVSATAMLAVQTGLSVIASGGVASLDDVRKLQPVASSGVVGVVIGKALYTGDVDLAQAIAVADRGAPKESTDVRLERG